MLISKEYEELCKEVWEIPEKIRALKERQKQAWKRIREIENDYFLQEEDSR